uniref:Uncharacterized protein n=1 Tax=Erythrocytic necrosis virus TaxID=1543320 RepID=A0A4D6QIF5_9VIRU|nr:hypothetical protein [Erythrocytic necrosis virus]
MFSINNKLKTQKIINRVVGYTPDKAVTGSSSLVNTPGIKRLLGSNGNHIQIPKGAIIDRIEFAGTENFNAGKFSIGLGAFNSPITFPLIVEASSTVACEPIGGIRCFNFEEPSGATDFALVSHNSFVNINASIPVNGVLQVSIFYHLREPFSV